MMEFVTSRAMMMVCGAMLMAAILVPMSQMMEDDTDSEISGLIESDALALDSFYSSDLDSMTIRGSAMLPSPEFTLKADGNMLTMTSPGGRTYTAALVHPIYGLDLGYGGTAKLTRTDSGIGVE